MNESRNSTGDAAWVGLCVLLVLLLAAGGGLVWVQRQRTIRAIEVAHMQADEARAVAEAARLEALRARQDVGSPPTAPSDETPAVTGQSQAGTAPVAQRKPLFPELYVNQDLWRHVASLADAEPDAKVFTLDPQTGDIRFGDGEHGARPPDGAATIQAEYRTGGGGTVTVFLPEADLQKCRLRAVRLADGTLRLELCESKSDE